MADDDNLYEGSTVFYGYDDLEVPVQRALEQYWHQAILKTASLLPLPPLPTEITTWTHDGQRMFINFFLLASNATTLAARLGMPPFVPPLIIRDGGDDLWTRFVQAVEAHVPSRGDELELTYGGLADELDTAWQEVEGEFGDVGPTTQLIYTLAVPWLLPLRLTYHESYGTPNGVTADRDNESTLQRCLRRRDTRESTGEGDVEACAKQELKPVVRAADAGMAGAVLELENVAGGAASAAVTVQMHDRLRQLAAEFKSRAGIAHNKNLQVASILLHHPGLKNTERGRLHIRAAQAEVYDATRVADAVRREYLSLLYRLPAEEQDTFYELLEEGIPDPLERSNVRRNRLNQRAREAKARAQARAEAQRRHEAQQARQSREQARMLSSLSAVHSEIARRDAAAAAAHLSAVLPRPPRPPPPPPPSSQLSKKRQRDDADSPPPPPPVVFAHKPTSDTPSRAAYNATHNPHADPAGDGGLLYFRMHPDMPGILFPLPSCARQIGEMQKYIEGFWHTFAADDTIVRMLVAYTDYVTRELVETLNMQMPDFKEVDLHAAHFMQAPRANIKTLQTAVESVFRRLGATRPASETIPWVELDAKVITPLRRRDASGNAYTDSPPKHPLEYPPPECIKFTDAAIDLRRGAPRRVWEATVVR